MAPLLKENILQVYELDSLTTFYVEALGMRTLHSPDGDANCVRVGYAEHSSGACQLELWAGKTRPPRSKRASYTRESGYWKIGITDSDIASLKAVVESFGIQVTEPRQFFDIGYLCHLEDPDGFCVELLGHQFSPPLKPLLPGSARTLGQITLRVWDIEKSLTFYGDVMGMHLVSRQAVPQHGFTLYFLASLEEEAPVDDIDDAGLREWLWQRPYTLLELQHYDKPPREQTAYRKYHGHDHGFWGLGFRSPDVGSFAESETVTPHVVTDVHAGAPFGDERSILLRDPDGYLVRVSPLFRDW